MLDILTTGSDTLSSVVRGSIYLGELNDREHMPCSSGGFPLLVGNIPVPLSAFMVPHTFNGVNINVF